MARPLASPALLFVSVVVLVGLVVLRRQRAEALGELLDAGFQRLRLAVAQPQDEGADQAQRHRDDEVQEIAHPPLTSRTCCAPVAQSSPPAQFSRFQIGALAFSVSIAKRAAAN